MANNVHPLYDEYERRNLPPNLTMIVVQEGNGHVAFFVELYLMAWGETFVQAVQKLYSFANDEFQDRECSFVGVKPTPAVVVQTLKNRPGSVRTLPVAIAQVIQ